MDKTYTCDLCGKEFKYDFDGAFLVQIRERCLPYKDVPYGWESGWMTLCDECSNGYFHFIKNAKERQSFKKQ